ncbi:hypothetical protein [Mucilaginibacter phyllosphaerae]|uniref:Curli biogenesis system outer membrane secretion channel CsgG n=1 Tax=Mucilaginibacter phyllosphaerae TaxID=1812349 RepID=A0A4Y8A8J6_9SPHI|nr:hypothetical protein [Mucilaginibacter phyllosphaerae]MBB3970689.1 curli biogenesis system outer membrane secretion channel CsgG [Mucilaginibacter phyllosphaerae]TEW64690.1 hypothetical protein E2R65_16895 [Mucilaginibacter phyllosphaerae]GGH20298.1 hypothetical protein GCM10007352_32200 [Mucilaginibacter phyllosphaerae]
MKKNLLALLVMLCSFAGAIHAQSLANVAKVTNANAADSRISKPAALVEAPAVTFAAADVSKVKEVDNTAPAVAPPPACYSYLISAAFTGGTFYYTTCGGIATSQYLDKGKTATVCAREGTVSGSGPITKGATCN